MKISVPIVFALTLFSACADNTEIADPIAESVVDLSAREQLIRLSVDLRGIHPTEPELAAYQANPDLWSQYVDRWLEDPAFLERMREVFNERYLTRTGDTYIDPRDRGLGSIDSRIVGDMVGDEPLQLLTYVIDNNLPLSTIVTADHSMATPVLAQFWGMDYPEGAVGWQPARYQDARPHAGMLTMKTVWERYPSMGGNANRHRANAISKMFLCDDYLSRPIVLNRAAVDQLTIDPENAIRTNISCQSCHSTLDPLSATLFGFWQTEDEDGFARTVYRQELEEEWRNHAGREPGYYGRPVSHLVDLGQRIAEDQRFVDCAVKTVFEGLTQRRVDDNDWSEIIPHANAFVSADQSVKELVRSIVNSPTYVAGGSTDPGFDDRLASVKTATPGQLASIIQDKTGYVWSVRGRELLTTNDRGLPVLMGGIDSRFVVEPNFVPTVGSAFAVERLAQAAGYHVAQRDLNPERTAPARLLRFVTVKDTPDNNADAFEVQIRSLYLDITGIPLHPEAQEPAELVKVWKYLYSVESDPARAWGAVVSAVLRDPRVLFY